MSEAFNIKSEVNQFPRRTMHHLHINHGNIDVNLRTRAETEVVWQPLVIEPVEMTGTVNGGFESRLEVVAASSNHLSSDATHRSSITHRELPHTQAYGAEHRIATQMGLEFDSALDSFLDEKSIPTDEFTIPQNVTGEVTKLLFNLNDGEESFRDIVIHALPGTSASFLIAAQSERGSGGAFGVRVRVFADEGSFVHVSFVNLLGKNFTCFEANASLVQDGACVSFTQVHLGGRNVFSGVRHTLSGYRAKNRGSLAYIALGSQNVDVNYVSCQIGRETESSFVTEGVVAGNASKTWRGTIDFVKGCSESKGNENENVLLLSPEAENKSLPVILCDEEAVEGSHGTSIGRLGLDMLFYLKSRGVSEEEAKTMMVRAKVNSVARSIGDSETEKAIENFIDGVLL